MNPSVEQILREHYVDGVFHTHVSMVQPRGKFQFNRQGREDFWNAYCDKIMNEKDPILGVAEKPQHYLPILVDIDLKIKETDEINFDEHLYTEEHVAQIVDVYQSVLRNIVEGCTDDQLLCVLLEKPIYFLTSGETTYIKNGFHLHFPNLFLSKVDQEVHLIPRVKNIVQEMQVFADLGIENSESVIDKSCCSVPWLMYGSRKTENMDPYEVTKVFNSEGIEVELEDAFKYYKIFDMYEKTIQIRGRVKEFLPRILSIVPYGRQIQEIKHGLISPLKEQLQKGKKKKSTIKVAVEEALNISEQLLALVADWRAEDRNEWMTIGWILFNIGDGCPQALEQWMQFSSRAEDKYDEARCIYEWDRMVKKDLTLGTLRHYAKTDNPEKYKEFTHKQADHHAKEAINGSHNDVAKILYAEYGTEFVCASISNKLWYQFRDHHWEEIEEGIFLKEKISNEIVQKYVGIANEINIELGNATDKPTMSMHQARIKLVHKIITNLKSSPYKQNIMKEALEVFYDRRFKSKLDQNPFLICFKNGVYDLKLNEFRAGRPEDFISKTLPIDYKQYEECDETVQSMLNFFHKVIPDSELREYFFDTYSDIFVGGNNQKKVYMWTGEGGDNGKSITQLFFEKMLGELAIKVNTQYFTGKKIASGSANPELSRAAPPVRLMTMEEPDGDEQLNIGELKKLSGGDSFWARDLFEKGKNTREVFPMFVITLICNKLPPLKYSDKATWNRIRVIPFESTFVEPGESCPETFEEQMRQKRFPMDKDLKHRVPEMVSAFAWYLLEWRKKMTGHLREPEKVREATAIYRRHNDIYRQFIEESIIEDNRSILTITELYVQFKEWFKDGWPNMKLPIKNEVKEYFDRCWGDSDIGSKWRGYRIRTLQDDVDDGSAIILREEDLVNYGDDGKCLPPV